ncbi:YiiX/YebB-like N1pC/P60 family cysteine hydrolase [Halobacteriovorax sp. HLS]|uniref:YiiX/YebB-like N1pC/P60 family cysteine hydrolase n=1 Tax=Halobacteriovorax sp. HLS TaxID=2234000 RepID=UPI0013E3962F|nr:YiiX/YebB-like N1pC/P60 family cysteine hydrolase [Halobacteriovorax sp. HLS]
MKLLILFLLCFRVSATEFQKFEKHLEYIRTHNYSSINKKHFAIYQHTLNLGSYSLDYLNTRQNGNGLFLELIKESWRSYIKITKELQADHNLLKVSELTGEQALNQLFIIERTQSLYNTYMDNKQTRVILKDQSLVLENKLKSFLETTLSSKVRDRINSIIKIVERNEVENKFESIIFTKYSNKEALNSFANLDAHVSDFFSRLLTISTNSLSYSFGAIAGPIEWGDGGQLRNDRAAIDKIYQELKPLDIIFEKKAYKLTDYTIPGYWGHNAVWLGTKEQLIELGIWESKELDPFRDRIENGQSIFEMRKWGITFANYEKWINMDAYASIRVKGILEKSKEDLLKIFRIFGEQMDKSYDFGFNADTSFKITCSEVIYLAYGDYNWPTERIFGRNTISPNGMAEAIFYKNSPYQFVSYVTGDEDKGATFHSKEYFANLMGFNAKKDGSFKKRYNECRLKYKRIRRGSIKLINHCIKKEKYLSL